MSGRRFVLALFSLAGIASAQTYIISSVAGTGVLGSSGDGGPAIAAQLNTPRGICLDSSGNLYIADTSNNRIRKVTPAGTISTVAGTGAGGFTGDGGQAVNAQFSHPNGVLADGAGNLYIADTGNDRVRKVSPSGIVTTIAGSGASGSSSDGGQALNTAFFEPAALALDDAGNLYIAETFYRVRKVSPGGAVTTVAGIGYPGYAGDGGPANIAQLNLVGDIYLDTAGNLYIADRGNNRIRKVSADGIITTVAGGAVAGYAGDGGQAVSAQLNGPTGITGDRAGNLYIADMGNHRVRKVSPSGTIDIFAGTGSQEYTGDQGAATSAGIGDPECVATDSAGNLYMSDTRGARVRFIQPGPGGLTLLRGSPLPVGTPGTPYVVLIGATGGTPPYTWSVPSGSLPTGVALADGLLSGTPTSPGSYTFTIQVRDSAGATAKMAYSLSIATPGPLTIVTGATLGAATVGTGYYQSFTAVGGTPPYTWSTTSGALPGSVYWDAVGTIFGVPSAAGTYTFTFQVRDSLLATASRSFTLSVLAAPKITTFAGTGDWGSSGDGGPAVVATLKRPGGVAVDTAGNVYIADSSNGRIRKVSSGGTITTVAGDGEFSYAGDGGPALSADLNSPYAVAADAAGNLYIADQYNGMIRKVLPTGYITTIAGAYTDGVTGDGVAAITARISQPQGVAVDSAGNVYFSDWGNHRVRKVSPDGIVHTVAGTGQAGYSGDGGLATSARLNNPTGVALDAAGNLFIADSANGSIRKVYPDGYITTVVGNGHLGTGGDGGFAASAQLSYPAGIAVDPWGNLFIADYGSSRIREVYASGIVTTVTGTGVAGYSGDGGPATKAQVYFPSGVAVDSAGNVYIADAPNNRIRIIRSPIVAPLAIATVSPLSQGMVKVPYSQTLSATGGTPPYTWSVPSGLPGGLTLSGATISGTPTAAGTYAITLQVKDASGTTVSKSPSLTSIPVASSLPVVFEGGVLNAASNAVGQPVAAGSLVSIYGLNLAPGISQAAAVPLPVLLNGVSVTFNGVAAPLHFVAPGQINAQVPWNVLPAGATSSMVPVVVTSGGVASAPVGILVGPFSPGIFALNYGVGNAIAINADGTLAAPADSVPGVSSRAAVAGDSAGLVILATGMGALDSVPANGAASLDKLRKTTTIPQVLLGGSRVSVTFSGASPQFVGVNQINVAIPSSTQGGDKLPLQLRAGGITTTNQVTIAVSGQTSACTNIAGTWVTTEKGTLTCTVTANGQSDTETDSINGGDLVTISQQDCQVSYTSSSITAAFGSGKSVRQGTVAGTSVTFSGIMGELASGFTYQKNVFQATGSVQNNVISLNGTGTLIGSGMWQGMNTTFSCTANTTSTMTKFQ